MIFANLRLMLYTIARHVALCPRHSADWQQEKPRTPASSRMSHILGKYHFELWNSVLATDNDNVDIIRNDVRAYCMCCLWSEVKG